jgi:RNA polymerase sigma-70 factor (ECF subfamily)
MVTSKEISEDLLQETFIKIWKNKHTYNVSKGTLFTWMLNIARNTAIDYIRSHRNQFYKRIVNDEVWQNEYLQPGTETGNISDRIDYLSLKRKTTMLDKKYSIIIDLIYFEGCTFEQVAKLLNLPIGTVKTRGRMALTLLKKAYR